MHELTIDPASTLNVAPAYVKPQYDKILGSKSSCFTPAQGAAKLANGCVNPWDVEHEPNSTIFPHLRETAIAGPSRSVEPDQMANCVPLAVGKGSNTRDSELVSPVAGLRPFWQPEWIHSCIGSTADIEMSEFPGSEATLPSSSSTATGDTSRVNSPVTGDTSRVDSPVTSTSSVSLAKEGKGIKIRPGSPVDIVNYAVVTPHDSKIESATSAEFAFPHDIMAASPQGVPPIRQTLLCNVASHVCEKCDLSFRTRGQLKNHDNRKHNLRFKCIFCTAAFGLRADLERHKITRHIDDLCQKPLKVFRCPVSGCPTSEKEYFRKDNFHKHMRRCSKAREKAKAKQEVSQSPD